MAANGSPWNDGCVCTALRWPSSRTASFWRCLPFSAFFCVGLAFSRFVLCVSDACSSASPANAPCSFFFVSEAFSCTTRLTRPILRMNALRFFRRLRWPRLSPDSASSPVSSSSSSSCSLSTGTCSSSAASTSSPKVAATAAAPSASVVCLAALVEGLAAATCDRNFFFWSRAMLDLDRVDGDANAMMRSIAANQAVRGDWWKRVARGQRGIGRCTLRDVGDTCGTWLLFFDGDASCADAARRKARCSVLEAASVRGASMNAGDVGTASYRFFRWRGGCEWRGWQAHAGCWFAD
ncbi:TPA: hypothetical protein N0F65_010427 [Lagenidium giganteum]|uniref:Uncharacterized protein n=1 Tax=Lagenidium giganteum TaxID=4803 RepID=A0AAV2YUR4_9STRA|nr:TPA: hypothetical protein N0F65_010427 [Lagenidium giganteum]